MLQTISEFLPVILKNEWCSVDVTIADAGATMESIYIRFLSDLDVMEFDTFVYLTQNPYKLKPIETPFWFIRCAAAGHWIANLLLQSLRIMLKETSGDALITTIMVLSQVDFANNGFSAFNEAISVAETKDSFNCTGIFDFISDSVVIERLASLASDRPQCFFSGQSER
ncbi:unnamed protein product [Strongylus vulgaris]|uniref:Uncharacterized protein n=1 Tax=Strongylus vulgaris TaxID=40348 RepID=A0A3P7IZ49_STRVU|nr:unnamed protein product [Strongylus vulgaris]